VDHVLRTTSVELAPGADWRRRSRPRAVGIMTAALETAASVHVDRQSTSRASLRRVCREAALAAETYY
jgi:hypothetical protein